MGNANRLGRSSGKLIGNILFEDISEAASNNQPPPAPTTTAAGMKDFWRLTMKMTPSLGYWLGLIYILSVIQRKWWLRDYSSKYK